MPTYESQSTVSGPEIPENTILNLEVVGVREVEKPWKDDDGNVVNRVEFSFIVKDPASEHDGRKLWGETPTTFSPSDRCKLRQWAQEILAQDLPGSYSLDTDTLVGRNCRGVVSQRIKKSTGDIHNFVSDVMRGKNSTPSSYEQF